MKKIKIIVLSLICSLSVMGNSCDNDTPIQPNELPAIAQQFIRQNFKDLTISLATKDFDSYEVIFSNGYKINFDKKGDWIEIDCKNDEVPQGIILPAIRDYVKTNFQNSYIVEISKERRSYDVELNNGVNIKFDKSGNFKEYDD